MTDKEKLGNLLKEFGLGYNLNPRVDYNTDTISLEEEYGNVKGYCGFCVDFTFDENGKFKECGIYE